MGAKHLPVGGSTAARTLACPAWLERAARLPKPPSNKYADEGNLLHDALEAYYDGGTPFAELLGVMEYAGITLSEEHLPMLYACSAQVEMVMDQYDVDEYLCEPFVELQPDYIGGSIDFLGLSKDRKTAVVLDYKTGRNAVKCEGNAQLLFYAACAQHDPKTRDLFAEVDTVAMVIVQPRTSEDPQIWEQPVSALEAFKHDLLESLAAPNKAAPGSHCEYCPAAPVCEERKHQARAAIVLAPKTSEEVAHALTLAKDLEAWAKQVIDQAESLAASGAALPGFKLVRGMSRRRYTEAAEAELINALGEQAYTKKLIPVTEAEKKLGKGELEKRGLVEKPEGNLVLVSDDDSRAAVVPDNNESLKLFVDSVSVKK